MRSIVALSLSALSLLSCASRARPSQAPANAAVSVGSNAPRTRLVAFAPYRSDRPFEVERELSIDLASPTVDPAVTQLFARLCEEGELRGGAITYRAQPFVEFDFDVEPCSALTRVRALISPRITALRHGATLASASDGQGRIELFLQKPAAGFADTHNHPWANLGYDNLVVWGPAWCALETHGVGCPANHSAHVAILSTATGDVHGASPAAGYPTFRDWPRWDNWTHLVSHPAMLYRAWRGGQRLLVGFAVNNYSGCVGAVSFARGQEARCADDEGATERQIRAAYWTQAFVDAQWGGPGRGWFRIVTTPREARRVMADGKLAVVLGIEVDSPFGCGPNSPQCTEAFVRRKLDEAYACGVRHMFPIHFWDNAFGGAGLQHQLSGPSAAAMASSDDRYDWPASRHFGDYGRLPFVDPMLEGVGAVNRRGLTALGRTFIRELMARRMIIDVDHQSDRSTLDVLEVTDDRRGQWTAGGDRYAYPITGGHVTALALMAGDARQEGNMTPEELRRIRDSGGMVSVITTIAKEHGWLVRDGNSGPIVERASDRAWAADTLPWNEMQSSQSFAHHVLLAAAVLPSGVGFGTDANGGNIQFGPRRTGPSWTGDHTFSLSDRCASGRHPCVPAQGVAYGSGVRLAADRWSSPRCAMDRLGPHHIESRGTSDVLRDNPSHTDQRHTFDYARDGLAHMGMLPDVVHDLRLQGVHETVVDVMLRSAEEYVSMWERAEIAAERLGLYHPAPARDACPWSIDSPPECPEVGAPVRYATAGGAR